MAEVQWRPIDGGDANPVRPRTEVLDEATESLGLDPSRFRWTIGAARQLPHSCVYPLVGTGDGVYRYPAWYKVGYAPSQFQAQSADVWINDVQSGLRRWSASARRFSAIAGPQSDVTVAQALAVDAEKLTVVVGHVPGRPLGKALSVRSARPWHQLAVYRRLGVLIRTLESVSDGTPPTLDETGCRARVERTLMLAAGRLDRDVLTRIEVRFAALLAELEAQPTPTAYVHGDLSPTNVLVDGSSVGAIDLEWKARPKGFDVATFLVRLERQRPRVAPWTDHLAGQLLEGYGELGPGYHVERSQRLLRLLVGSEPSHGAGRTRVLDELQGDNVR